MGLIEKQARQLLETETIPHYEREIRNFAPGAATRLEIDWDSLGDDRKAWLALANTPVSAIYNVAIGSTMWLLEEMCRSELVREAIAGGLKAIRVVHQRGVELGHSAFEGGVLTLTVDTTLEGSPDADVIRQQLMDAL
jgi:hypothetical protein